MSGGVLIAAFGLLGTTEAHAEPKNTAGTPSAPAKKAADVHGGSANAAEHRQAKDERRKASGSHSSSANSAERRQQKADEKRSGRSNSGSSANAAEHRQKKEDQRRAERRQRDYAESQRGGSPGSGLRRQIDSAREKGQKAEVDRLVKLRNTQQEQRQQDYRKYVPAWKAYAESQRGGAPGTGLQRQLDAAREKADRLAVGPGAASTGGAALVRRGREAAAALAEVRRLEQQQERHAQRRQAELDEKLRETQKYAAAWSAYGESQRGGAPGTADNRRKLAEQARIAQGQLDYIDATRGKEVGGRTAQVVERLPDGRLRVTDAKSLQSAVVETKDFLHPPASVEAEFVTAPDKEVVAERRKLEVRDWQKLPGGQHPGVSVGSTEDGKLVAVSRGALPADVAAKLRDGWVVERGTSTADGRDVTVFHPRTRFQDNFEDLEQQWQRAFRDRRVDLPQVGRALAGSAALAVDGHVLGQGNLYGTGKDCFGGGKNCGALLGESALTAANAFPVGRLGRIGRIVEETGGAAGVAKGARGAKYEASPKHGTTQRGNAAPAPTNGQAVLEKSVQVKDTSTRRVGADPETGEFVVFDETLPGQGVFHGHTRSWDELTDQMRNALRRAGIVNARGKITGG